MIWVVLFRMLVVDGLIRCGHDEQPLLLQETLDLCKERLMGLNVFNRFKADDHIKGMGFRNGYFRDRRLQELQIGSGVLLRSMANRSSVDVNANDKIGSSRKKVGAISFTGSEVEHALPLNESRHPEIAVKMLVSDRRLVDPRHEPLTSPIQH